MPDDQEIEAMRAISGALDGLSDEAVRNRVLVWASSRYGAPSILPASRKMQQPSGDLEFTDFPSLFDAARPRTNEERALVAGYWFQKAQGQGDLDSQSLNTALKNLGHGDPNITWSLGRLMKRKPALVLQVHKSGKSKQARKKYRLTAAGIRAVETMALGVRVEEAEEES